MFILVMNLQFGLGLARRAHLHPSWHHVGWLAGWNQSYLKANSLMWLQVTLAVSQVPSCAVAWSTTHGLSMWPRRPHDMVTGSVRERARPNLGRLYDPTSEARQHPVCRVVC